MTMNKEIEYEVIILTNEKKEIRLKIKTADPFTVRDQLKNEYGDDTIISFENPEESEKLRG